MTSKFVTSKHFILSEFDSRDQPGSGSNMQRSTLAMLEKAREIAGVPFIINSGYRTPAHNKAVGGSDTSSHLKGYAVDVAVNPMNRDRIMGAMVSAGFRRVGIAKTFLHVDNDPTKPNATWYY